MATGYHPIVVGPSDISVRPRRFLTFWRCTHSCWLETGAERVWCVVVVSLVGSGQHAKEAAASAHSHALINDTPPARAGVSQSTRVNVSERPVEVGRNVEQRTDFRGNDAFPRYNNSNTRQACWAALGSEPVGCSRIEQLLRSGHTSGSSRHLRLPQTTAGSWSSDSRSTRSSRREGSSSPVS